MSETSSQTRRAPEAATPRIEVADRDRSTDVTTTVRQSTVPDAITDVVFEAKDVSVFYGGTPAVRNIDLKVPKGEITALIGPSGCGKSTMLRTFNRMNDLIPGCTIEGSITYHGEDIYADDIDPAEVRRRIGMVFQKPNPFGISIYDNVAFGPRLQGVKKKADLDEVVQTSLERANLWKETKDILGRNGLALSGGQQQRLCIARVLAVEPEVMLMDEPCSAIDPTSVQKIEDLMDELKDRITIVIVTHNMQQAARVSDFTAFFLQELAGEPAVLVEYDRTSSIFTSPKDRRTEDYITGRFG